MVILSRPMDEFSMGTVATWNVTKLSSLVGESYLTLLIPGESLPVAKQEEPIEEEDCPVG